MNSVNFSGAPRACVALAVVASCSVWAEAGPAAPQVLAPAPALESGVEAQAPRFDIFLFEVEGNTVLPVLTIEHIVTPFLGAKRTLGDVELARAALERAYQSAGYLTVFVDVPEQRVDGGTVRLKVLEGRVERLSVSGSRYYSQGYIRAQVAELADGRVPNFNEAQRQLATVNRSEERRVQPVLRPGRLPGTVEVELKVTDQLPIEGSVELHNEHAQGTDPLRLQASLRYGNLFQRDHSISLTAITAPRETQQSSVLLLGYTVPVDGGASLSLSGAYSNSNVETLGGTSVVSSGTTVGLRYLMPFGAGEGSTHSLTTGLDYKNLTEQTDISTPLRYAPFQLAYGGFWFGSGGRNTQLTASFTAAFRKLLDKKVDCLASDGSAVDQFACKRYGGDGGFYKLVLDLRHTEPLWWGSSLALRLGGQLADTPLPSAEQYAVGGSDTVRGYLEGSASGDRGVLGSAEWRSPNLVAKWWPQRDADKAPAAAGAAPAQPWVRSLLAHGFVDVARTNTLQPLPGQAARAPLLGSGVGLRLVAVGGLEAGVDVAWPHKNTAAMTERGPRAHARLKLKF